MSEKSLRGQEWDEFSVVVMDHVENYCVPQYGDMPEDQMTTASLEDIKHNLGRYVNRMGKGLRGPEEELRDMRKVAHYACLAYNKILAKQKG